MATIYHKIRSRRESKKTTLSPPPPAAQVRDFGLLFKDARTHSCSRGQVFVRPDEQPQGVFFIRAGYVKAYSISNDGECQLVAILGPSEIFPLHWALEEQQEQLFYESIDTVSFSVIDKVTFKSQVMADRHLLQVAISTLLASFRFSHQRIQNLQLHSARQRLACRLLYLAENFGTPLETMIDIRVPVVYQDLADAVGITRETANRVLRQFVAEGIVNRSSHHLIIVNADSLRSILES